jgi:hypothetical protein
MADAIFAAVLGVVIAAACIGIPQLVRVRHQQPDDDTQAYLSQTGRTAQEIAAGNAAMREQQQGEAAARRDR